MKQQKINYQDICLDKPKKSYRIIIQQRKPLKNHTCKSFMIYDYNGNSTIDKIKERLTKLK